MKSQPVSLLKFFAYAVMFVSGLLICLSYYISFVATNDCDLADQVLIFTLIGFLFFCLAAVLNLKSLVQKPKSVFSVILSV